MHSYQEFNGPVVVQGNPVTNPTIQYNRIPEVAKGTKQPKRFNDVLFSALFLIHLGVLTILSLVYIPQMNDGGRRLSSIVEMDESSYFSSSILKFNRRLEDADYGDVDPLAFLLLVVYAGIIGFFMSVLSLGFMIRFAELLIRLGLLLNIVFGLITGLAGLLAGLTEAAVMGFLMMAFGACFACMVWSRIPFAASNLTTASTAVRANIGVSFYAYLSIFVMIGWFVWWSAVAGSTMSILGNCDEDWQCENDVNGFVIFLFTLSLYWTFQVIKNIVHVTVAGTVGTWWWQPEEANSPCSSAVTQSFYRSVTYSFGSICLGSLLVAIIQTIREFCHRLRESDDGLLLCLADCILGCIQSLVEMFNNWAYVYVGIYGYSFVDSAKNVMTLFKERGWTAIITDSLVDSCLSMISMGVGLIVGLISALLCLTFNMGVSHTIGFFLGLVVGFILTQVLMGVVSSAVNTIIVCYAEDPNTFQNNYPELSANMVETWRQAYPGTFTY